MARIRPASLFSSSLAKRAPRTPFFLLRKREGRGFSLFFRWREQSFFFLSFSSFHNAAVLFDQKRKMNDFASLPGGDVSFPFLKIDACPLGRNSTPGRLKGMKKRRSFFSPSANSPSFLPPLQKIRRILPPFVQRQKSFSFSFFRFSVRVFFFFPRRKIFLCASRERKEFLFSLLPLGEWQYYSLFFSFPQIELKYDVPSLFLL